MKKRLVGLVLLVGISAACSEYSPKIDALATDSVANSTEIDSGTDGVAQVTDTKRDPFLYFNMEAGEAAVTATKQTPVWLINEAAAYLVMSGRAGAEAVVIDTLAGGDSVLVNLETWADTVVLTAREIGGRSAGSVAVPMDAELQRVAFPR